MILFIIFALFCVGNSCEVGEFECRNKQRCMVFTWVCDTEADCRDRSDETGCFESPCPWDKFTCMDSKRCIPRTWHCDNHLDCVDGSDEYNCSHMLHAANANTTIPTSRTSKPNANILGTSRERAEKWLMAQPAESHKWAEDVARVLTALYLGKNTEDSNATDGKILLRQDFNVKLAVAFLRKDVTTGSLAEMALYIHALAASCENPRNFYGINLVEIFKSGIAKTRSSGRFVNPFLYLVLCNVHGLDEGDVESFLQNSHLNNEHHREDILFLEMMALSCFAKQFRRRDLSSRLSELVEKISELQRPDGSFGDIYSTALATQALMSGSNDELWNKESAVSFLLSHQSEDGSFGDVLSTYLVLPILTNKTLLSLGNITCPNAKSETEQSLEQLKLLPGEKNTIHYNLWIGNPVEISYSVIIEVPQNISFFDIMMLAADTSPQFRFKWHHSPQGRVVHSLGGLPNDAEKGTYWTLYVTEDAQGGEEILVSNISLSSLIHVEDLENSLVPFRGGVDQLFPNDEDRIVYWLRHD